MDFVSASKRFLDKNSGVILMGIGTLGVIATAVEASRATPKYVSIKSQTLYNDEGFIEESKLFLKHYYKAILLGATSVSCFILANRRYIREAAAATSSYYIVETAFKKYQNAVIDELGEKKERKIRDKVSEVEVQKADICHVIKTTYGKTLCLDVISGRLFESDIEHIRKTQNDLNARLIQDMYISLNEVYDDLGLKHIKIGDDLGWNIDNGTMEFEFSSQLTSDGRPCLVIDYKVAPLRDYKNWY